MFFSRDDWTLFRNLTTLGQKAGVPQERLASLVLKEIVDNALDTGSTCDIKLHEGWYYISDNGPGIDGTDEEIASLFSIRRPLSSSKLLRLPTRGALGNGLRVVAGSVLASGGKLRVTTRGRMLQLEPQDDGGTKVTRVGPSTRTGTLVEIAFGPSLSGQKNPMAMANWAIKMRGESRYEGKSSPWWYDSDSFFELLQATSDDTSVEDVLAMVISPKKIPATASVTQAYLVMPANKVSREQSESLLAFLRNEKSPPKPHALGVVGEMAMPADGYAKKLTVFELPASRGSLPAHIPAVIEVWASKIEDRKAEPSVQFFVNRTPISAIPRCGMKGGKQGKMYIIGSGINHYFDTGKFPMNITLCVTTPYMSVTTDGKEPNFLSMFSAITDAITSAARKAKAATRALHGSSSQKDTIKELIPRAIQVASGKGKHRYSLRQLFYAIRPLLQARGLDEPSYNYFSTVVGEAESEQRSDMPGMYRDARGSFVHPHEPGRAMSLGTLGVEKYKRPEWRFNKVLYIEKGGFFPLLADEKWAERHDCALLTSQGFASRAARDLIDLLGESDEPLRFFCIHDADGPGTNIFQALVEGTMARPGRKVEVVNLGLDPWEAEAMGLISEKVERKKGAVPVAKYVEEYDDDNGTRWKEWLQTARYELNAMNSPAFLRWLDAKMEEQDGKKVIPPHDVLAKKFNEMGRKIVFDKLVADAIEKLGLNQKADAIWELVEMPEDLEGLVDEALEEVQEHPWETPVLEIATHLAMEKYGKGLSS